MRLKVLRYPRIREGGTCKLKEKIQDTQYLTGETVLVLWTVGVREATFRFPAHPASLDLK